MNRISRIAAVCLLLCFPAAAESEHDIAVKEVWFENTPDGHALRARLSAGSEKTIRPLLESGYIIKLKFEMRFMQNRDWLPDRTLGDISWQVQIVYDSLLNRYTFAAGGVAEEYKTLAEALMRAGRLRAAPQKSSGLNDIFALPEMYVVARYEMLIDHLPQPLQISLLTGEWEIDSGWQRFAADLRE